VLVLQAGQQLVQVAAAPHHLTVPPITQDLLLKVAQVVVSVHLSRLVARLVLLLLRLSRKGGTHWERL